MLDQHFELFRGLESGLVRKVLQARAMGEADTLERLSNTNDKVLM